MLNRITGYRKELEEAERLKWFKLERTKLREPEDEKSRQEVLVGSLQKILGEMLQKGDWGKLPSCMRIWEEMGKENLYEACWA